MELLAFVLFVPYVLLACVGLTWIAMYGSIVDPIRDELIKVPFFNKLLKCAKCTGTWVGASVMVVLATLVLLVGLEGAVIVGTIALLPFASSAICFIADRITLMCDELHYMLRAANAPL